MYTLHNIKNFAVPPCGTLPRHAFPNPLFRPVHFRVFSVFRGRISPIFFSPQKSAFSGFTVENTRLCGEFEVSSGESVVGFGGFVVGSGEFKPTLSESNSPKTFVFTTFNLNLIFRA